MFETQSLAGIEQFYTFKQVIGEGSLGQTKRAILIEMDKTVAIKCIQKKRVSEQDLNAYKQQSRLIFENCHPNITQIYEFYEDQHYFYVVMEFLKGGELLAPKNLHKCRTQSQICQIFKILTDTLNFCHSRGIIHRQFKPQNILWSQTTQGSILKITDFGFGKFSKQLLFASSYNSSIFFAPEIIKNQNFDQSVDYWSLGVILYILLSGKTPFKGENQDQIQNEIINEQIDFKDNSWKYVSAGAKDLILRLLEKNPKSRYKAAEIILHPWVNDDHNRQIQWINRELNLQNFEANRKIEKLKAIIDITLNQIQSETLLQRSQQAE